MHCNNGSEHLHSCLVCSMLHIVKSSLCSSRLLLLYALSFFWRQTSWIYCLQSLLSGIQFKLQILLFFGASFFLLQIWLVSWNSDSNQDLCIPLPLRQSGSSPLFDQIWIALSWQPNPTGNVYFCICVIDQDSFIMTAKFVLEEGYADPPPPAPFLDPNTRSGWVDA